MLIVGKMLHAFGEASFAIAYKQLRHRSHSAHVVCDRFADLVQRWLLRATNSIISPSELREINHRPAIPGGLWGRSNMPSLLRLS